MENSQQQFNPPNFSETRQLYNPANQGMRRLFPSYPNNIRLPVNQTPGQLTLQQSPFECFGCFSKDHMLGECPRMHELIQQGILEYEPASRKFCMKNSRMPIRRRPGECLYEAALRMNSIMPPLNRIRNTNFVTLGQSEIDQSESLALQNSVAEFYANQEEYEENDTDSDSEDDGPYWKYALHTKRRLRYPETRYQYFKSESEEDNYAAAYPAARSSKKTTEARERVSKIPSKPPKMVFDGVYPPRRNRNPPNRASEPTTAPPQPQQVIQNEPPAPQSVPQQASQPISHPTRHAPSRPIDVRKLRPNQDLLMEVDLEEPIPAKTARTLPKDPTPHSSANKENAGRGPTRQSEISQQIDTREVVKEILDTEITIPIRKIIGSSREIATDLQDVIKLKNTKPPTTAGASLIGQTFTQAAVLHSNTQGALIKITLHHEGKSVMAIVDTGSELNIIRSDVANKLRLPVDVTRSITMNDANGGEGQLVGFSEGVQLSCGKVDTTADLWVGGNTLPFDLLLGRTWQQDNLVSTEERLDAQGTLRRIFRSPQAQKEASQHHII
ncbi:hypothetical protein GALMADRAFT_217754 [Galerina marginata CBS 339.88]|uniref:DUF4100 domain-containing protein n=1 Tax=Galerina marginata (strain CBS 339.88) TaxID=685588 RepID=A0A067SAU3_GALM3|nr:hypothetical protein GALMADRAFT_217754 [Galerina marginata CBS 339.88]